MDSVGWLVALLAVSYAQIFALCSNVNHLGGDIRGMRGI